MGAEMTVEGMISVFMKIRKVYADEFGRMLGNETYSPNEISILLFWQIILQSIRTVSYVHVSAFPRRLYAEV